MGPGGRAGQTDAESGATGVGLRGTEQRQASPQDASLRIATAYSLPHSAFFADVGVETPRSDAEGLSDLARY